jgi:hypothetical protein
MTIFDTTPMNRNGPGLALGLCAAKLNRGKDASGGK